GEYVTGPLFTPPSLRDAPDGKKGTLTAPSAWGSGNWNTGAFDPERGVYYAVSMTMPGTYPLEKPREPNATIGYDVPERHGDEPTPYGPGPQGVPLVNPPYGRITALDLNKGEKLWTVANGDGPRSAPALKGLNLPPLGTLGRPVPLVTKSLLFLGEA